MAIDWAGLKQYYTTPFRAIGQVASIKPGETIQSLKDRLGIGTTEAKAAATQGVGTFVPTTALPITTQPTSALPIQPSPTGQPIYSPAAGVPTQPTIQPQTQPVVQPVSTGVSGVQPTVSPEAQDITKQIEETKAKLKAAQAAQTAMQAGYAVSAPGEKPAVTTEAYGRALGEKTPFEQYAEAIRKAQEPLVSAYTQYTDTLANLPSSVETYSQLATQYGLSDLEGNIKDITGKAYGVEAQIEALPEDVKARVQDFLITQGQADRLTAAEAKPLTALYNAMARERGLMLQDLEGRRAMVNSMLGLVEKDTQRKLQALELGTKLAGLGAEMEVGLAKTGFEIATKEAEALTKAPEIIGSADTGYYQWDSTTKQFKQIIEPGAVAGTLREVSGVGVVRIKPDGGYEVVVPEGKGITERKAEQTALVNLMSQVPTYTSREEALTDLERNKTSVTIQVGQEGYDQIKTEIDRIFPEVEEATETKGFWQRLFGG